MNKKKRDKQELYDKYSSMPRHELVKECIRMGTRLEALSEICDIDDVYNAYYEQQKAQRDAMMANRHVAKVKEVLQKTLTERGIRYNDKWDIKTLAHFLVSGTKQQSINQ